MEGQRVRSYNKLVCVGLFLLPGLGWEEVWGGVECVARFKKSNVLELHLALWALEVSVIW